MQSCCHYLVDLLCDFKKPIVIILTPKKQVDIQLKLKDLYFMKNDKVPGA